MPEALRFSPWDWALIAVVSVHAAVIAYAYQPKWKALLLSLPVPFTLAALAVGRPVDATNALGLILLLGFVHAVRLLHYNLHLPIVPAIAVSAACYCAAGSAASPLVPATETAFWLAAAAAVAVAAVIYRLTPRKVEPGHRTPLPVWIKLPAVALVIVLIVVIKSYLRGFMTTFPMLAVITAYEARHSLWTICRQISVVAIVLMLLMLACRLGQNHIGLAPSLAVGWGLFLAVMIPYTRYQWSRPPAGQQGDD